MKKYHPCQNLCLKIIMKEACEYKALTCLKLHGKSK